MSERSEPWILEVGHHRTRLGRSGEVKPTLSEHSVVGAPRVPDDLSLKETGIWPLSPSMKLDHTYLAHPLTGQFSGGANEAQSPNSEALYTILKNGIEKLEQDDFKHSKCLVIEPTSGLKGFRETLSELLFEHFDLKSVLFQKSGPLALYACARTSGINIDLGYRGVVVSAVQEGLVSNSGTAVIPSGGSYVIEHLLGELTQKGLDLPPYYEALTDHVHHHPFVENEYRSWAIRATAETILFGSDERQDEIIAKLPDGELVRKIARDIRIPGLVVNSARESKGLTLGDAVGSVVEAAGFTGNTDMLNSLVVHGGMARSDAVLEGVRASIKEAQENCRPHPDFLGGLPCVDVAQWEIDRSTPLPWGWRLLYPKDLEERTISPFIGASILGSLAVFDAVAVDRRSYAESGLKAFGSLA